MTKKEIIAHTIACFEVKLRKAKEWEEKINYGEDIEELGNGNLIDAICDYFDNWETLREYFKRLREEEEHEQLMKEIKEEKTEV